MNKYLPILLPIIFTGCSIKTLPPVKKYFISSQTYIKKVKKSQKNCKSIKVDFPESDNKIMSNNIIYVKGFEKNAYYFSKWYESPNQMLNKLFYSAIKQSRICLNTYYKNMNFPSTYTLKSEILNFSQKFNKNISFAQVKIIFYIVRKDNSLMAEKEFKINQICDSNNAKGGIIALSQASRKVTDKMVSWLIKILSRSH